MSLTRRLQPTRHQKQRRIAEATGYWIQDKFIWGPRESGKYWIEDSWIWGPQNGRKYWIQDKFIWSPKENGNFWIDRKYIRIHIWSSCKSPLARLNANLTRASRRILYVGASRRIRSRLKLVVRQGNGFREFSKHDCRTRAGHLLIGMPVAS